MATCIHIVIQRYEEVQSANKDENLMTTFDRVLAGTPESDDRNSHGDSDCSDPQPKYGLCDVDHTIVWLC